MEVIVTKEQKSLITEIIIVVMAISAIGIIVLSDIPIIAAPIAVLSAILAYQYYDRQLLFAIDENGIYDARLGVGKIFWRDVSHVQIEICYRTRFLCLRLKNPDKFVRQAHPAVRKKLVENESLGFSQINIDISGVEMNALLLKQFIEDKIA